MKSHVKVEVLSANTHEFPDSEVTAVDTAVTEVVTVVPATAADLAAGLADRVPIVAVLIEDGKKIPLFTSLMYRISNKKEKFVFVRFH